MLYYIIVFLRNKLFDWQILKSKKFDIPIISVGNITVGGTGKTPHIEYFIREFLPQKRVAVLSRGYKRKTSGFVLADENCTAQTIGDEPYQIYKKFPEILVAVDEKRVRGIEKLLALPTPPEVILLDDAFQHRYVTPSDNILLINYNRHIFSDKILPYGRLREPISAIKRADRVIITKCPENLSEQEKKYFVERISRHFDRREKSRENGRKQNQANSSENTKRFLPSVEMTACPPVSFSSFKYSIPKNIFTKEPMNISVKRDFLVVTGVVNANGLYDYLQNFAEKIYKMKFADHHNFTEKDIKKITLAFDSAQAPCSATALECLIITTEKDRARLLDNPFISNDLKEKMFYVEIEISMNICNC